MFTQRHMGVGQPAKIYIYQVCVDTGCSLEDYTRAMSDRDGWRESQGELCCQQHFMMIVHVIIGPLKVDVIIGLVKWM